MPIQALLSFNSNRELDNVALQMSLKNPFRKSTSDKELNLWIETKKTRITLPQQLPE